MSNLFKRTMAALLCALSLCSLLPLQADAAASPVISSQKAGSYHSSYGYDNLRSAKNGNNMQKFYKAIDEKAQAFHASKTANAKNNVAFSVDFRKYNLTATQAETVWAVYKADHPLYYWISNSLTFADDGLQVTTDKKYAKATSRQSYNKYITKQIKAYSGKYSSKDTKYQKALALHDAIINSVNYAYNEDGSPEDALWAHNIMGVFLKDGAVCEGYAEAFQLLLNYAGIQNILVSGTAGGDQHAWNLVRMDDNKWYWFDLTWDDLNPDPDYGALWQWPARYDYFCATDEHFLSDHTINTPENTGAFYQSPLPKRSTKAYDSSKLLLQETFTTKSMTFAKVGYKQVELRSTTRKGAVTIPETITYKNRTYSVISVGSTDSTRIFDWDAAVTSVTIPKSIRFIWDFALQNDSLKAIKVSSKNPYFSAKDGVLFTKNYYTLIQYPANKGATRYTIPSKTHLLGYQAFSTLNKLKQLTLGINVEAAGMANWGNGYQDKAPTGGFGGNVIVGDFAAIKTALGKGGKIIVPKKNPYLCADSVGLYSKDKSTLLCILDSSIESFHIPKTLKNLHGEKAIFSNGAPKLKKITVEAGHSRYFSYNGILYSHGETYELLYVPEKISGSVTIPASVEVIPGQAFWCCADLTSVTILNGTVSINAHAFYNCTKLQKVTLPKSVTTIEDYAFDGCTKLKAVYYGGTKTQKKRINIGIDNDDLTGASWRYSYKPTTTKVKLTKQPTGGSVAVGKSFTLSAKASGKGLYYQWYTRGQNDDQFYQVYGANEANYKFKLNDWGTNIQAYCLITDLYGNQVKTRTVTVKSK